jgi:hypothetical protein
MRALGKFLVGHCLATCGTTDEYQIESERCRGPTDVEWSRHGSDSPNEALKKSLRRKNGTPDPIRRDRGPCGLGCVGRVQPALLEHASSTRGTGRRFQMGAAVKSEHPSQLGDRRFTKLEYEPFSLTVQIRGLVPRSQCSCPTCHLTPSATSLPTRGTTPGLFSAGSAISRSSAPRPTRRRQVPVCSCGGRWRDFSLGGAFGSREPRPAPCGRRRLKEGA